MAMSILSRRHHIQGATRDTTKETLLLTFAYATISASDSLHAPSFSSRSPRSRPSALSRLQHRQITKFLPVPRRHPSVVLDHMLDLLLDLRLRRHDLVHRQLVKRPRTLNVFQCRC